MTDFADVEQFARQHAGCGGLTPSAIPQADGGFTLTLTCTCGAGFDRRVTAEEAKQPLPQIQIASRPSPRERRPPERRRVAPSRELEDAMRAALEAETHTVERPAAASP